MGELSVDASLEDANESSEKAGLFQLVRSVRFLMAILVMAGIFCQYAAKLDLSVNIVCMTENSTLNSSHPNDLLKWSNNRQQNLLAAFFYGYILSEIPGGLLAQKLGSKITMALGIGLCSLCSWHYGIAAEKSYGFMFTLRVLVGVGSGVILPAASNVWTSWAPRSERSFLIALATSGAHVAPIVILPLTGVLCEHGFTSVKWKSAFYVVAILEMIWLIVWMLLFSNSPKKSKLISEKELNLIEQNLETRESAAHHLNAPWKSIFTSKPCLALFACHTFANWGFYTLLVEVPTYFNDVFDTPVRENGLLSSLPYIVIWITTTVSSFVADYLLKRNIIRSRTLIRKVAVAVGTFLPGIFLLGLAFGNEQLNVAVTCLTLGQGLFGITWGAGHMCNANDIAPVHAGIVFGISNTLATIPGIITTYVKDILTSDGNGSQVFGWKIVFIISAVFMFLAGIVFILFGSGKAQKWDSDLKLEHHRASYVSMQ